MLLRLAIRDYLLAENLELEFSPGLTVLTGETGAGKSLLVDALALLLGGRAEPDLVRAGAGRAELAAEFVLAGRPETLAWLTQAGIAPEDESCLLRRTVEREGRSRAWINGTPVTLAQLRELGELLMDIHGQHAHHSLLRAEVQRALLDEYAGALDLAARVAAAWRAWQQAAEQSRRALAEQDHLTREKAETQALLAELAPVEGDAARWAELVAEHSRLAHLHSLLQSAARAIELLSEGESAALMQLNAASHELVQMGEVDASLAPLIQTLASAQAEVQETARELQRYADHLNPDPERQQELDRSMGEIHRLARKHRVAPEELPPLAARLRTRMEELAAARDVHQLAETEARARADYRESAEQLSRMREKASRALTKSVNAALKELALSDARFAVALEPWLEPRAGGRESVAFQVSAHASLALGPLDKVASGGELSRISLALQTVLSSRAGVPTLVFDEVDVGIGGAVAEAVGRRLAALAARRQVLVITHLPQVAACGQQHLRIRKAAANGSVATEVEALDRAARVEEIARMLGGKEITATTRRHASEMLAHSASVQ